MDKKILVAVALTALFSGSVMAGDDAMAGHDKMAGDKAMASDKAMAGDKAMASDDAMAGHDKMAGDKAMAGPAAPQLKAFMAKPTPTQEFYKTPHAPTAEMGQLSGDGSTEGTARTNNPAWAGGAMADSGAAPAASGTSPAAM